MYICKDTNETALTYKEYLLTTHWRNLKEKMYKSKYKYECYSCKCKTKLELHHKTYKRIGNERLNDMIWLCRDCHEATHKVNKQGTQLWKCAKKVRKNKS